MTRRVRTRRIWRIVGLIIATLVILGAATWTFASIKYSRLLANELASLRAQGYPLSAAEAKPKPVPDTLNAAVLYMKIFQVHFEPQANAAPQGATGLNRFHFPSDFKFRNEPITPSLRAFMANPEMQPALVTLREASLRPYSVFPVKWEAGPAVLFPHMAQFRQATRLVSAQALLEAEAGNTAQALDWLAVNYRMAAHAQQEPTLIAELVAIACRAIAFQAAKQVICPADLTAAEAAPLQHLLASQRVTESFTRALRGEMACGLSFFSSLRQNNIRDLGEFLGGDRSFRQSFVAWLVKLRLWRPYWDLETYNYVRAMSRMIEASKQPVRLTSKAAEMVPPRMGLGHIMAGMLVPMFSKANGKRDQSLAEIALVQTALMLKVYHHEHGSYPDTLTALPAQAPEDPFSGQPLVYWRQKQGFKLYSWGPNLRDDGGHEPAKPSDLITQGDIVWECAK